MSDKIIKEGYLTKRGHAVKNWKLRWFILRETLNKDIFLDYFEKKDKPAKGKIDLNEKDFKVEQCDSETGKNYTFKIFVEGKKDRSYYIQARDQEECDDWMLELLNALGRHAEHDEIQSRISRKATRRLELSDNSRSPTIQGNSPQVVLLEKTSKVAARLKLDAQDNETEDTNTKDWEANKDDTSDWEAKQNKEWDAKQSKDDTKGWEAKQNKESKKQNNTADWEAKKDDTKGWEAKQNKEDTKNWEAKKDDTSAWEAKKDDTSDWEAKQNKEWDAKKDDTKNKDKKEKKNLYFF